MILLPAVSGTGLTGNNEKRVLDTGREGITDAADSAVGDFSARGVRKHQIYFLGIKGM